MSDVLAIHRARLRRRAALVVLLGLGALASVVLDLVSGPSGLPLGQVIGALTGAEGVPRAAEVIVWQVRLPVALMALLVGAALSVAGAEMQIVLDNPLAEPFTLGVSAAAALGAGVAIVLGLSLPGLPALWGVSANAFLFALGALGLLQLASALRGGGTEVVILLGIAVNFTAGAVLALVQFVASPDALQQLVFWTMGSLANARWEGIWLIGGVLALCLPFSVAASWRLTALRLGAEQARGFGVDVGALRRWTLVRVSLLAAAAVSMVGVIGFVGLAGPHIARLAVGEDHRFALPASLFTGALLMSLASVLSKMLVPGVLLPVGIVTSLVGLPVFFALVLRRGQGMTLTVEGLTVARGPRRVIDGLTLPPFAAGEFAVIAGPNAAGKSTLLRAIARLLPMRGRVTLDGDDLAALPRAELARRIGFMPQQIEARSALSVLDSLLVAMNAGGAVGGTGRALEVLARFGLEDLALRPLDALSGGQRQAVALAQAMIRDPRLLLLDEPTSALDLARQFALLREARALAREGRIVIAVLHDLAQAAQWADRIVMLAQGGLAACGPPEDVLTPALLRRVYGIDARVERCSHLRLMVMVDGQAED